MDYKDTSRTALKAYIPAEDAINGRVMGMLRQAPSTCDEVEVALDLLHQTASPALLALERQGLAKRTNAKRSTRTGRPAYVWAVV